MHTILDGFNLNNVTNTKNQSQIGDDDEAFARFLQNEEDKSNVSTKINNLCCPLQSFTVIQLQRRKQKEQRKQQQRQLSRLNLKNNFNTQQQKKDKNTKKDIIKIEEGVNTTQLSLNLNLNPNHRYNHNYHHNLQKIP